MTEAEKLAERLKVAEEIIKGRQESWVCNLHDVSLRWSHDSHTKKKEYTAQRTTNHGGYISGGGPDLAVSECPIDCIILARQKLAAEREAAMTPEHKKLRDAASAVIAIHKKHPYTGYINEPMRALEKALEES